MEVLSVSRSWQNEGGGVVHEITCEWQLQPSTARGSQEQTVMLLVMGVVQVDVSRAAQLGNVSTNILPPLSLAASQVPRQKLGTSPSHVIGASQTCRISVGAPQWSWLAHAASEGIKTGGDRVLSQRAGSVRQGEELPATAQPVASKQMGKKRVNWPLRQLGGGEAH